MEAGAAGSGAWSRFLRYAARAHAKPTFHAEERDHRLDLAGRIRSLLDEARATDAASWEFDGSFLARVGPPYFLIPPPTGEWVSRWAADGPSLYEALARFDGTDDPVARFAAFAHAAEHGGPDAEPNLVLAFGSLLNFALAPLELPIMRQRDFSFLSRLDSRVQQRRSSTVDVYRANLVLAANVETDLANAGIPVRDMLDTQSLIVICSQERDLWLAGTGAAAGERPGGDGGRRTRRPERYLSLCACLGYDTEYLVEWIEFHRLSGFERFFLYNNGDRAAQADLLAPYIELGIVVLHDWPTFPPMVSAFDHCIEQHGSESRWIAFIDTDEFLFSPSGRSLGEVLSGCEPWPAVGVNSVMFGSSGHQTKPPGLVIESYRHRTSDPWFNSFIKSIVDPARTIRCLGPHHFEYRDGLAVDENHYAIKGQLTKSVSAERLRINHYHTKSREEFQRKLRTRLPSAWVSGRTSRAGWLDEQAMVQDEAILRFLPQLRERIASAPARLPDPA